MFKLISNHCTKLYPVLVANKLCLSTYPQESSHLHFKKKGETGGNAALLNQVKNNIENLEGSFHPDPSSVFCAT